VSVDGIPRRTIARIPEANREGANDLDSGLAPVTPEAAGSSPVDPANSLARSVVSGIDVLRRRGARAPLGTSPVDPANYPSVDKGFLFLREPACKQAGGRGVGLFARRGLYGRYSTPISPCFGATD